MSCPHAPIDVIANKLRVLIVRGGVSFAEILKEIPEAKGDLCLSPEKYPKIVIWVNVSHDFVDAFNRMVGSGEIVVSGASPLIYMIDGVTLNYPVARSLRHYKKIHWFPVTLSGSRK